MMGKISIIGKIIGIAKKTNAQVYDNYEHNNLTSNDWVAKFISTKKGDSKGNCLYTFQEVPMCS